MTITTETNETKHYVAYVAPALLQREGLSDNAKLVAITLLMHRNRETGFCYATQETLGLELGKSESTVKRAIAELKSIALIRAESRKAPRGYAKGRANLYDLDGLLTLCSEPILNAKEIGKRKKPATRPKVSPVTSHASEKRATSRDEQRHASDRSPVTPRDRSPVTPHASDFRAIEQNSNSSIYILDAPLRSATSAEPGQSDSLVPVSEFCSQTQEKGEVSPVTSHSAGNAQRVAPGARSPEGRSYTPGGDDPWQAAEYAVRRAGGERFNNGELNRLIDECGDELVWLHAQWFLRRLAALDKPPNKPTPYFIKCVRENFPVNPRWPEYCHTIHGKLTDEQRSTMPRGDDPREWSSWVGSFDGLQVTDMPPHVKAKFDADSNACFAVLLDAEDRRTAIADETASAA